VRWPSIKLPIVVLLSGNGSNLQKLIEASQVDLPVRICAVISSNPQAYGLQRAKQAGIPAWVVNHRDYVDRPTFERALEKVIDNFSPKLVVLAGFMRILGTAFVRHYPMQLINIHPSLLPEFRGLQTHERALAAATKVHGCSIHFVTPELDDGPVILQVEVPILAEDTVHTLEQRVHQAEYLAYPRAIGWIAQHRITVVDGQVLLDGRRQPQQYLHFPSDVN